MNEFGDANLSIADDRFAGIGMSCREEMRTATRPAHERLHHHAGFSSVQDGTITLSDYRSLLVRLYGFYLPFERATGTDHSRTDWLERDLAWLGADTPKVPNLQLCATLPRFDSPPRRLGALYVAEGSALGGRQLSRGLDRLLGTEALDGRRFFVGRGDGTGAAWHSFRNRLARAGRDPARRRLLVSAAIETFELFENWLSGWRDMR